MGSLILNKKLFSQVILKSYEEKYIRFKGPVGLSLINFIDPTYYSVFNTEYALNMYINGDINDPITFYTDGIDWYNSSGSEIVNDYVVPINAVFRLKNDILNYSAVNLGQNANVNAMAENFYSGKTSIKKQNLTKLKSSSFHNLNESYYIFRSATNNTLAQIFNPNQFEAFADNLAVYDINLNPLSLNNGGNAFYPDGSSWFYDDFTTNADNYVIPANTVLLFSTIINFDISIGGGAVIEKYYSGKLSLGKQNYKILKDGEVYIFLSGNNNTISTFLDNSETVFGASGIGTEIFIYNSQNNLYVGYLRRTSTSWRDSNNVTVNNLVIQPNSRIIIQRSLTGNTTVQGTNIIQKYY